MWIDADTIITFMSALSALGAIIGMILKMHSWYLRIETLEKKYNALEAKHNRDIDSMREENGMICQSLLACLDGLEQLGANHNVPTAKNNLEEYINEKAHGQHGG